MKKNVKVITCAALSMMMANTGIVLYAKDDEETSKDETVYAMLNSDGTVNETIVSSWLHNDNGISNIKEKIDMQNVKNVKSDDQPKVDGKTYTWNVKSNDVYYEGTTTKQLPVSVHVTYKLNGKKIDGKDLIGKSGQLEIHISLKNTQTKTVTINGKATRIHPFYVGAGIIDLSTDHFSNVKCEHGKIMSEGNNTMVAIMSVPGLADTLESSGIDKAKELNIRDEFTITCDTKDFELGPIMFAMTPEVPVEKLKNINSMDDLTKGLDELTSASEQLLDGTTQLSQGTTTFASKMGDLVNGLPTLTNGINTLKNGSQQLISGAGKLDSGTTTLAQGLEKAKAGTSELNKATDGLGTMVAGVNTIDTNMQTLAKGLKDGSAELNATLRDDMLAALQESLKNVPAMQKTLAADQANVAAAGKQLAAALQDTENDPTNDLTAVGAYLKNSCSVEADQQNAESCKALAALGSANTKLTNYKQNVAASATNLNDQLTQLQKDSENLNNLMSMTTSVQGMLPKLSKLKENMNTAAAGAQQLAEGTAELNKKASALVDLKKGITTLDDKMGTAVSGAKELSNGSKDLVAGLQSVDQGIGKLQSGSGTITNGASQLYAAAGTLKEKTGELNSGMSKFKTSGIDEMNKQVSLTLDEVNQLLAIKDELVKEAEDEHSFTGAPEKSESKVKFIYKTEELQKEKKADTTEKKQTKEESKDHFFDKITSFFSKLF